MHDSSLTQKLKTRLFGHDRHDLVHCGVSQFRAYCTMIQVLRLVYLLSYSCISVCTRSSFIADVLRDMPSVDISSMLHSCTKITLECLALVMTLKVTQGHRNCLYLIGHTLHPISGL